MTRLFKCVAGGYRFISYDRPRHWAPFCFQGGRAIARQGSGGGRRRSAGHRQKWRRSPLAPVWPFHTHKWVLFFSPCGPLGAPSGAPLNAPIMISKCQTVCSGASHLSLKLGLYYDTKVLNKNPRNLIYIIYNISHKSSHKYKASVICQPCCNLWLHN